MYRPVWAPGPGWPGAAAITAIDAGLDGRPVGPPRSSARGLEILWAGQKYVDPHPPEDYPDLLRVRMATAPLNGNVQQSNNGTDLA